MAPTIWGFNLGEMSWGAFSSRRMFSDRWHLRSERFVVYQLAMLICLAAECTATYSLSKYEKLQTNIQLASPGASLYNNDIVGAEIVTIVFCVLVATIFGADFFFLLFFPRRTYPVWYNASRKAFAVVITCGLFAAAVASAVIVARHSAIISGVSQEEAQSLVQTFYRPPLRYRDWPTNIAYVVLLWIGLACTIASTVLMLLAVDHDEEVGPEEHPRRKGVRGMLGQRY